MMTLQKILVNNRGRFLLFSRLLPLLGLLALGAPTPGRAAAYYSVGTPVVATPAQVCTSVTAASVTVVTCRDVVVPGSSSSGTAATVYFPLVPTTARVRLQLNGQAGPGYRAGVVLAQLSTLLGLGTFGDITLRTFLSTKSATVAQETRVVAASVVQAQLLAAKGLPTQLEFVASQPFDQVEIGFDTPVSAGQGLQLKYAYAIGVNAGVPVGGYLSQFGTAQAGQYGTGGSCASAIDHPERAVDGDLSNYATFSALATVACPGLLQTQLNGTAPGTYRAGFVVGGAGLADADLLGGLTLRTYLGGVEQEHATGSSLLAVSVLPSGQRLLSFPANTPFDAVAIERNGLVTALDNLPLYYGLGVATVSPVPPVLSNFSSGAGHAAVETAGVGVGSVSGADNAAGPNLNTPATIRVAAGVLNSTTLRLDLNGGGNAGNRAGVVLGQNSLLDVAALSRLTLITYDKDNNVIESASGASLLSVSLLPDGRQQVSFNTTRDFAKVAIRFGGVAEAVDTHDVYYAFADSYNGSISVINPSPSVPLPVSLVGFGVRRASGTGQVAVSWTTASEQQSAYFVVERTANPAAGWAAVGRVAAAGSSLGTRHYALLDAAPAGTLYYRLRQVDQDGHEALSGVAVVAGGSIEFRVYPNPAPVGTAAVMVAGSAGGGLSVYSATGQLLRQQPGTEAPNTLDIHDLPAGLYRVVVRGAQGEVVAARQLAVSGE